jgi:sugar phosphate isomerase/epimerase
VVDPGATQSVDEPAAFPGLVASFFTLSGAGFVEPPRNTFIERCEAAAAAGFTGIGLHSDDLPRTVAAGVAVAEMQAVLRLNGLALVEIEFLGGWAFSAPGSGGISPTLAGIEAVAAELGGRQVSAGEFSGETPLDTEEATGSPSGGCWSPSNRSPGPRWPTPASRSICCAAPRPRTPAC